MIVPQDIQSIQMSNGFIGEIWGNDPIEDSFWEKVDYAYAIGKPAYLIMNGTIKYSASLLRKIFSYDWREIYITDTGRFDPKYPLIVYHPGDGTMRDDPHAIKKWIDSDIKYHKLLGGR